MTSADNQGRDVREKVVRLKPSITHAPRKQLGEAELYRFKVAASRLAQMLKAAVNAERQALLSAAGNLDQLLSRISTGQDATAELKRLQKMTDAIKSRHTTQPPEPC